MNRAVMFLCPILVGKGIKPILNGFVDQMILDVKTKNKNKMNFILKSSLCIIRLTGV